MTSGTRTYPWRVLGIADRDGDLITNQLVYLLETPSKVEDTSWIHPGKVSWDWWNDWNIDGVDFHAGINTKTYEYYVDFAAKYGLPYIILDDGWYKLGDLLTVTPDLNMEELVAYAKQKNVGLILWASWKTLDDQLIPALDQFEKWGIKGIKVDFMQRSDQIMINYFDKVCRCKCYLIVRPTTCVNRKRCSSFPSCRRSGMKPGFSTRRYPSMSCWRAAMVRTGTSAR